MSIIFIKEADELAYHFFSGDEPAFLKPHEEKFFVDGGWAEWTNPQPYTGHRMICSWPGIPDPSVAGDGAEVVVKTARPEHAEKVGVWRSNGSVWGRVVISDTGEPGTGNNVTVVNTLASTSTVAALSAAMGKSLKDADDAHASASDPHPQYLTPDEADGRYVQPGAIGSTIAPLVGGRLPAANLPDIAVSEHLGVVASQAEMLALNGQRGDWCTRMDLGTNWVLSGDSPSQMSNWVQLSYPVAPVTSVAGRTGAVTLAKADVGLANVDNTPDSSKPVSTAQAAAIGAKYSLPAGGVPLTDLAAAVQTSLGLANSAAQYDAAFTEASQDVFGAMVAAAGGTYNDATGAVTFPAGGGSASAGFTYVDMAAAGVSETTGDAYDVISAAINAAHNGVGVAPDRVVFGPPGRYRIRRRMNFLNVSVDASAPGCVFVVDDAQVTPTTSADFLVASTTGWPTTGTFRVQTIAGAWETISYTGTATGKFTGCTGGTGAAVEPGSLVTNNTNATRASIRSGAPTADVLSFSVDATAEVAVTSIGGRTQTVGIPELYVYSANAFPSTGSLTVTTAPTYPGGATGTATCTYTGKTPYSFTGCTWSGSGLIAQGANVTNGTNTTQTYPTQVAYPFRTTKIRGAQDAGSATISVDDSYILSSLVSSTYPAGIRVRNSAGGWEYIQFTGVTGNTLTGCTLGTAGSTLADGATVYADGPRDGAFKTSVGTRIYCTTTAAHKYGAVIKIGSDDRLNPLGFNENGTDTIELRGEYATIVGVFPDSIVVDTELRLDYLTNPRIITLAEGYFCTLSDWHVAYINPRPSETRTIAGWLGWLGVEGFIEPRVTNVGATHWPGPMFGVSNCYRPRLGTFFPRWLLSSTLNGQIGYGVNINSAQDGTIDGIYGIGCRHLFTTNAADQGRAVHPVAVTNCGGTIDVAIDRIVSLNPESFPFDTHTDAIGVICNNLVVYDGAVHPRTEQTGAAQFRGFYGCGVRNMHYVGNGIAFLAQIAPGNYFIDRITGSFPYLMQGGVGKREYNTTTVSTGVTTSTSVAFTLTVADASFLPAGPSWVQVPTTDNGTVRINYTSISSNVLQGCLADKVGTIVSTARVWRETWDQSWMRIGEIDVEPSGGTTFMTWQGAAPLNIGKMIVRYGPETFRPQGALAHTMLSIATDNNNPETARVHIDDLRIDISRYPSAASIPVRLDMIGLDQRNTYRQYDQRRVSIGKLSIAYGNGMGSGPTSTKFSVFKGASIVQDGVWIDEWNEDQGGVAADSFDGVAYRGTFSSTLYVGSGTRRGANGTVRPIGTQRVSLSSATSSLYHLGSTFSLLTSHARQLDCTAVVTSASAKVTSLQAPAYHGQRWQLMCEPSSANPLVIATGQISNVGADLSVPAGSSVTLVGAAGAWVKYAAV